MNGRSIAWGFLVVAIGVSVPGSAAAQQAAAPVNEVRWSEGYPKHRDALPGGNGSADIHGIYTEAPGWQLLWVNVQALPKTGGILITHDLDNHGGAIGRRSGRTVAPTRVVVPPGEWNLVLVGVYVRPRVIVPDVAMYLTALRPVSITAGQAIESPEPRD